MSSWNAAQYQRSTSGSYPAPGSGPAAGASGSSDSRYANYQPPQAQPQAILQSSYAQQGYPGGYDGQYSNSEYSNSHYAGHNYYPNDPPFSAPPVNGANNGGTASPGARSGQGVVDPSAPEPFPPASNSPGARQMSHEITSHHNYDSYYSNPPGNYGSYDGYPSQYGGENPQSASASSWSTVAHQKVPNSAPVHGSSGNGYNSYHNNNSNYSSAGQQQYANNYGYSNGPQSAQPYYNQGNYLSGNQTTSASQWNQPWSGGVNPQAMSGYSSSYNRGVPPQPQALAAAAQAANQFPGSHGKGSPVAMYSQGTMPPQAVQTNITPQQAASLPPPSLAAVAASAINPQAVSGDYAGLGKRSAEDIMPASAGGMKKVKLTKKEEKEKNAPTEPPAPTKSHLKPPKQAHSAWQLFFTDQLNAAKANAKPDSKLNVAHVAKDAGELYKRIPIEAKAEYNRRAAEAREQYHKELEVWKATLTPEDIKLENAFRAGQRKAGKSRKGNMKDTNAPKKPLSAYFLFLKAIRTSAELTRRVFETETETTKQSMMAAKRWRGFDDEQKKPFLRQAEADKAEYETLKKQYEEDAAARLRGESPEHRSFVPTYATDEVPRELLPAVIPNEVCDMETLLVKPSPESHHHHIKASPPDLDHIKASPDSIAAFIKAEDEGHAHHDDLTADLPTPSADPTQLSEHEHIPDIADFVKLDESTIPLGNL